MGKDRFGSFLQEANEDVYDKKVEAVKFYEVEAPGLKIEWALKGEELIIHLYKAPRAQWSLARYPKKLYELMDEFAKGESREIGYEDIVDSWYIKSEGFVSGKLDSNKAAEVLCKKLLNGLVSSSN